MKTRIAKISLNILLIILGIFTLLPFVWMILSSFKSNVEINALNQTLFPKEFTISNYLTMNENFNFLRFFARRIYYLGKKCLGRKSALSNTLGWGC